MAKNISLLGANYPNVPAVQLPQTGGGTATFYDIEIAYVTGTHTFSCQAQTWSDAGSEAYSVPSGFTRDKIVAIEAHVAGSSWARCVASRANNDNYIAFMVWNNTALTDATIEYKITLIK